MPSKQWKNLDELDAGALGTAGRRDEFDPQVQAALTALRTEYGIDEAGEVHRPIAVASDEERSDHGDDLRRLLPPVSRRGFLKLTGAAAVFGLAGCWHKPPETLVPYAEQPEGTTLGKPRFYSTAVRIDGQCLPVMAKLYDGRPIKLEGNPDDPYGGGSLSLRGQAALLELYDPDRYQDGPQHDGASATWAQLDKAVGEAIASGGVGLLSGPVDGFASVSLLSRLRRAMGDRFQHAVYHPYDSGVAAEIRGEAFGDEQAVPVSYRFDRAKAIVTFGSCPIAGGGTDHYDHVGIGANRRLKQAGEHAEMGKLVSFEPIVTQTGTVADLRQRVAMEHMATVAWGVAWRVAELLGRSENMPRAIKKAHFEDARDHVGKHPALRDAEHDNAIEFAAQALVAAKGEGIAYVGGAVHSDERSRPLHQAAAFLNWVLGNEGTTVETLQRMTASRSDHAATRALLADAAAGRLGTLILWETDPAFSLPGAADQLAAARSKGCLVVALAERPTATARASEWVAPTSHALESWGDGEPRPGLHVVQQAVIPPLWDNRAAEQSLLAFAAAAGFDGLTREQQTGGAVRTSVVSRRVLYDPAAAGALSWQAIVKEIWQTGVRGASGSAAGAQAFWKAALARGFVLLPTSGPGSAASFNGDAVPAPPLATPAGLKLVLSPSRTLGDGAMANNAWLQETPDPVSKVTWDNYLALSISDAKALGLGRDGIATLTVGDRTITVPIQIQPGQLKGTVELFLGWGQDEHFGSVAACGGLGQEINAFELGGPGWGIDCEVAKVPGSYELASTQYHHYMDGRDIVHHESIEVHRADPDGSKRAAHHHKLWTDGTGAVNGGLTETQGDGHNLSLWGQTHVYPGRRWGMSIDLNACDGCGACIVACNAENNIPVVGRDEVRRGREMHWMRIDRYYSTPLGVDSIESDKLRHLTKSDDENESVIIEQEDPEDLAILHQPMMCQHCGHAPCEEVCPAMATMHNEEAVNIMIYNRCIGTRFCANNCPYKVRRFNYYEYSKYRHGPETDSPFGRIMRNVTLEGSTSSQEELGSWDAPLALMLNPAVTVRSKGVMEKCNFCVQRTRDIREIEKRSNRAYDDGDRTLTTACAQTCPTQSITFGDIADPFSAVSQQKDRMPHHYEVLDKVLNTRPAVSYFKRIHNRPATASEMAALEGGHGGHGEHQDHDHGDGHDHGDHDHGDGHASLLRRNPLTEGKA